MKTWTPIATRRRNGHALVWKKIEGAPMTIKAAQRAFARGLIFMAHRHAGPDLIELVVRKAKTKHAGTDLYLSPLERLKRPENTL